VTLDEVHSQYRKLAQDSHPDASGSTDAFRRLTEDYHLVSACLSSHQEVQPMHEMSSRERQSATGLGLSIRRPGGSGALNLSGVFANA